VGSAGVRNGGGILHEYLPCGQGQFRQLTAPKQNPATFATCAAWQCANWHWRSLLAITRRWPRQSPRLRCLTGTQPTWAAGKKVRVLIQANKWTRRRRTLRAGSTANLKTTCPRICSSRMIRVV